MSPAVSYTSRHTPLLLVWIHIARMEVQAILYSRGSPPAVGERVAKKLRIW